MWRKCLIKDNCSSLATLVGKELWAKVAEPQTIRARDLKGNLGIMFDALELNILDANGKIGIASLDAILWLDRCDDDYCEEPRMIPPEEWSDPRWIGC